MISYKYNIYILLLLFVLLLLYMHTSVLNMSALTLFQIKTIKRVSPGLNTGWQIMRCGGRFYIIIKHSHHMTTGDLPRDGAFHSNKYMNY